MLKNNYQIFCHLMLSLVGLAICIHSIGLQTGSPANPGPGFMPFGTGILVLILSLVGIFKKVVRNFNPDIKRLDK